MFFKFRLPGLLDDFVLRDLIRLLELERPLRPIGLPAWGVLKFLAFRCGPTFEPLSSQHLRVVTMKVLFLLVWCPLHSLLKNALSFFLRQVIVDADTLWEGSFVRTHSIQGVATSAAFLRNWSVSKVLEAATWRSNPVFASFYFRDLSYSLDGCSSLGPFVAAGSVIP